MIKHLPRVLIVLNIVNLHTLEHPKHSTRYHRTSFIMMFVKLCTSDIYLISLVSLIGSIRLSFANEIDQLHLKGTDIRRVLHWSSSISALLEQPFLGGWVSVAQLVASMTGVVLGSVVEVVGSNLARGQIFYSIYRLSCKLIYIYKYCMYLYQILYITHI